MSFKAKIKKSKANENLFTLSFENMSEGKLLTLIRSLNLNVKDAQDSGRESPLADELLIQIRAAVKETPLNGVPSGVLVNS